MGKPDNNQYYKWDVFISHASEDRLSVALPLSKKLIEKNLRVWLDEHQLTLGDSLRRKIDEGLSKSRFGVVILSEAFFSKEWPQKELDALISREDAKEKVILPIWHKVDHAFLKKYSPILADKLAISTSHGLDEVVEEILISINRNRNPIIFTLSDIQILLDQMKWRRHHEGAFSNNHPLQAIEEKLSVEGVGTKLDNHELEMLLNITVENMKYVAGYDYKTSITEAEAMRSTALSPVLEVIQKLRDMTANL